MVNSDNSIQINIKFTFTVHEYIIVYEYIWIYSIIQIDIYIYIFIYTVYTIYVYIYTGFTFIWPFPAGFTSRNGLHNSQENTCARDYVLIKYACNFIKKESLAQLFSSEFCEISKNTSFTEHLRTTASVIST